jgi:ferredoxin--NADP+ reductase
MRMASTFPHLVRKQSPVSRRWQSQDKAAPTTSAHGSLVNGPSYDKTTPMEGWTDVTVLQKTEWSPHLITLELDFTPPAFAAGQFFNVGLMIDGQLVRRSYSAASAPTEPLQVLVSRVASGALSPGLFALSAGDRVRLDPTPLGYFTLSEVPPASTLWLVATGTGLGPYVSMWREGTIWDRFETVVVVHGVRHPDELAYAAELDALSRERAGLRYLPVVSGPVAPARPAALRGRITDALRSGALEATLGQGFTEDAHMLLCGNPKMIDEMSEILKGRGFTKHRRRSPGHFNFEKYW